MCNIEDYLKDCLKGYLKDSLKIDLEVGNVYNNGLFCMDELKLKISLKLDEKVISSAAVVLDGTNLGYTKVIVKENK